MPNPVPTSLPQRVYRRSFLTTSIAALAASGLISAGAFAAAVPFTWDTDSGTAGAQDGSGTWDTSTANWLNSGGTDVVWTNSASNQAIFGGGVDGADGAYAVTVGLGTTGAADSIVFNNSGYALSASTAQTITLSNSTATISVANGKSATIGSNVTIASATSGANAAITGGGTLNLSGTFQFNGGTSSNIVTIAGTSGGGSGTTLNLKAGSIIDGIAGVATATGGIFVNGALNMSGGTANFASTIGIGQSTAETVGGTITISGGTLKTTNTSNGIRFGGNSGTTPGGTIELDGNGTTNGTLSTPQIIKGTGTVLSSVFNFNGGILQAQGGGGAIFMGGLSQANVRDGGAKIDTGGVTITISQPLLHSTIGGDAATDGGLKVQGSGTLILTGANTYNGPTTFANNAALQLANSSALGSSSVTSLTDQIQLAGNITINNAIRVSGSIGADGILKNVSGNNILTNFGFTSNSGTRVAVKAGSSLEITNGFILPTSGASAQAFRVVGDSTSTRGTLQLDGDNSTAIGSNAFLIGEGTNLAPTLKVGDDKSFGSGTITINALSVPTITSKDSTAHTFANLVSIGSSTTFGAAGTGDLTFNGLTTLTASVTATVLNTNTTFGASVVGTGFGLTKAGNGNLILNGPNNSYSGTTTVTAGQLTVHGALSGTTGVAVNGGSLVLAASDVINNAATLSLGGGTFNTNSFNETVGALTLTGSASTIDFGVGNITSVLQLADSSLASWSGAATLSITDWNGSFTGGGADQLFFGNSGATLTAGKIAAITFINPAGLTGTYGAQLLPSGELVAVPEPGSAALLIFGCLALPAMRRSRKS